MNGTHTQMAKTMTEISYQIEVVGGYVESFDSYEKADKRYRHLLDTTFLFVRLWQVTKRLKKEGNHEAK